MKLKTKHIDASREARLWLGQVIIPTVTVVGSVLSIPEVRYSIANKMNEVKHKINKTKKGQSK